MEKKFKTCYLIFIKKEKNLELPAVDLLRTCYFVLDIITRKPVYPV